MSAEQDTQEGVQSLYSGVSHEASWERSYNADGQVYSSVRQLRQDWNDFLQESIDQDRRRALMRCYVTQDLLCQLNDLPIEAAIPMGNEYLIWIGQNQHESVSLSRDVWSLSPTQPVELSSRYYLDNQVGFDDVEDLTQLWEQFGWIRDAVLNFVRNNANGNPIILIRTLEQQAIGAMIAESVEFGARRLVEITELAVNPDHRGQHLAAILIQEIAQLSLEYWEDALVFGEYNLTSQSYLSAHRAGQIPGQLNSQLPGRRGQVTEINGVLRDHVGIETGSGNEIIAPWDTQWLHNFLVMYQLNNRIR